MGAQAEEVDLFIIGGGINGCGIARDAVGRGLTVALAEQGDLAQATSSASTPELALSCRTSRMHSWATRPFVPA